MSDRQTDIIEKVTHFPWWYVFDNIRAYRMSWLKLRVILALVWYTRWMLIMKKCVLPFRSQWPFT